MSQWMTLIPLSSFRGGATRCVSRIGAEGSAWCGVGRTGAEGPEWSGVSRTGAEGSEWSDVSRSASGSDRMLVGSVVWSWNLTQWIVRTDVSASVELSLSVTGRPLKLMVVFSALLHSGRVGRGRGRRSRTEATRGTGRAGPL